MTDEFLAGTVAAATTGALALAAAWWQWRTRTAEAVRQSCFLAGIGVGALCGPPVAAAVSAMSGDPSHWGLAGPLAGAGIMVGALAGYWAQKRAGRPRGRPAQEREDYDDASDERPG
jgi:MFS family permease